MLPAPFATLLAAGLLTLSAPVAAQTAPTAPAGPSYAALATLADGAPLAVRVKVKDQAVVAVERAAVPHAAE